MKTRARRKALIVVDLAYGDCGKGTIVDYLARLHPGALVVRFNGGPQAGHNVVTNDGKHHTFSQFGSGSFVVPANTLLSRFMLIEPYALINEAAHLADVGFQNPLATLNIDARCPVITPPHQAANRLREIARGCEAHGTCGAGVGELMSDSISHPELTIRAAELIDRVGLRRKLGAIRELKIDQLKDSIGSLMQIPEARPAIQTLLDPAWIEIAIENYIHVARRALILQADQVNRLLNDSSTLILEGAQGVLLDESFGFHPHTTWSTTTTANAHMLLTEAGSDCHRTSIGVLRTYFTKHGAGPFVTESRDIRTQISEAHNSDLGWQGPFRAGVFDAVAARYAVGVAGSIDMLAMTHADRLRQLPAEICMGYRALSDEANPEKSISHLEAIAPVDLSAREAFTGTLRRCVPIMRNVSEQNFLHAIEGELGKPIGIISSGPTARDKHRRLEI